MLDAPGEDLSDFAAVAMGFVIHVMSATMR